MNASSMDRRVKERLLGATLLVVVIVLVVPELLSGPRPASAPAPSTAVPATTRSVSVDLTTSQATSEPDAPAAPAPSPEASPAPAVHASPEAPAPPSHSEEAAPEEGSGTDASSAPSVTTLRAQEPAPAPALETPASTPRSRKQATRGWSVQLGSFASKGNAERLEHQLQGRAGAPVYLSASGSGASLRYRVRVGPLADRAAAERAAGKLRAAGHAATVVTAAP